MSLFSLPVQFHTMPLTDHSQNYALDLLRFFSEAHKYIELSHKFCTVHLAVCELITIDCAYHVKWSVITKIWTSLPP